MITILDYGAGNVRSVKNALKRLNVSYEVTDDPARLKVAEKVIFPGVGAAGSAMKALSERELVEVFKELKVPVLGICLGMQLLFEFSEENETECLGVIPGDVVRFKKEGLKIPQIGWNRVKTVRDFDLFKGISEDSYFYFVHSYCVPLSSATEAVSFYGAPFSAAVQKDNFYGFQFHPEKSGEVGLSVLRNFIEL